MARPEDEASDTRQHSELPKHRCLLSELVAWKDLVAVHSSDEVN